MNQNKGLKWRNYESIRKEIVCKREREKGRKREREKKTNYIVTFKIACYH